MTNKKRQEIIDYLEKGDKFTDLLISELKRTDLETYEKRTYSSLLDALLGATELYCAMNEWGDNIVFINRQADVEPQEEKAITIEHGPRTIEKVLEVSNFVKDLPLSNNQNDNLIELMKDQLLIAEHEAYIQGFIDCMKVVQEGGFQGLEDKLQAIVKHNK